MSIYAPIINNQSYTSFSRFIEFWSVNHTSMYENSQWNISEYLLVNNLVADQMTGLEQKSTRLLNHVDIDYWEY